MPSASRSGTRSCRTSSDVGEKHDRRPTKIDVSIESAGTFYYHGELVFLDVRHPEHAIIVSLEHERYKKLIVEVADPSQAVTRLREARSAAG